MPFEENLLKLYISHHTSYTYNTVYTTDSYGNTILEKKNKVGYVPSSDKERIRKIANNASVKHTDRIENIKRCILNLKPDQTKKYQVRGWNEAKSILSFCEEFKDEYRAEVVIDKELMTDKLVTIYGSYNSDCCRDCDGKPEYKTTKVNVMYVKVKKL